MTLKQKIKSFFDRTKKEVFSRSVGTFNGHCPVCKTHIGAPIRMLLKTKFVKCGHCNHMFEVD